MNLFLLLFFCNLENIFKIIMWFSILAVQYNQMGNFFFFNFSVDLL